MGCSIRSRTLYWATGACHSENFPLNNQNFIKFATKSHSKCTTYVPLGCIVCGVIESSKHSSIAVRSFGILNTAIHACSSSSVRSRRKVVADVLNRGMHVALFLLGFKFAAAHVASLCLTAVNHVPHR